MRPATVLCLLAAAGLLSGPPATAQNGVMMQYFHWYLPADGSLWRQVQEEAADLAKAGFTALWLPPATKAAGGALDVGYGIYDLYDLGEFDQKGSVRTKYGTREDYLAAIAQVHAAGMQVYADVVLNHKGGADTTERVRAVRVARDDRTVEWGGDVWIDAWTRFDFAGRGDAYSDFKWRWFHFDGVDWAEDLGDSSIFKFRGTGKDWDWPVDTENGNYDYLLYADLDLNHPEVIDELKSWAEWYLVQTGVDGFRLDAVKHIDYDFFGDWLGHLRGVTGKDLFTVAEFWSYDVGALHRYISATGGAVSLFDAPLHDNFHQASKSGGQYDMRRILDHTLMKEHPVLAVTLVDNHDTQPCQALESPVDDWFKPLAYAVILLRGEGYPNVFYADYYGARYDDCRNVEIRSHRAIIDLLLGARRNYAYGLQIDYLDHPDLIGWTRHGDADHPNGLAVLLSDGPGGVKWMDTGRGGAIFREITGQFATPVTTNQWGWGGFPVQGGSLSVWVGEMPETAPGEVLFVCAEGHTLPGQNVYAVGSIADLGGWDPERAVLLSPVAYPVWQGSIVVPPNSSFEWKCVKREDLEVIWQPGPNNLHPGSGSVTRGSF